jgi:hypothetical protein
MVELVDTQVSEACGRKVVRVQVSFPEHFPSFKENLNQGNLFALAISS